MIENVNDAISYLRSLDKVYVPSNYTYWHHNTYYQDRVEKSKTNYSKAWEEMPAEDFYVEYTLSCVEREARIREAYDYGGPEHASISYAHPENSKTFAIRIIMTKNNLSPDIYKDMSLTADEIDMLKREYRGLGDMRHPKLAAKEHIIMIGSSTVDEVSGKPIDILYGVREQDAIAYATEVSRQKNIELELDNNGLDRYKSQGRTSLNPNESLVMLSEFEQDYYNKINKGETKTR